MHRTPPSTVVLGPTSKNLTASPAIPAISSTRPAPQGNNTATADGSPVSSEASDQITRANTAARACPLEVQDLEGLVKWMTPTSIEAPEEAGNSHTAPSVS